MKWHRNRILVSVLVVAMVGALLGIAPSMAQNTVEVVLTEYEIDMPESIPAGPTAFRVRNGGRIVHNFRIRGEGIDNAFDTVIQPQNTRTMELDLEPGRYTITCPVAGHAALGMRARLQVVAQEEPTATPRPTRAPTATPTRMVAMAIEGAAVATPGVPLEEDVEVQLVRVTDGLVDPINVVSPRDGSGRLFVVERPGRVRIVQDGEIMEEPFIDLTDKVLSAFLEQGLYDIAFHPDFGENGYVYVHMAELMRNGDSMIIRYTVSEDDENVLDTESAKVIMQIDQPYANHNGGELAFGPDGYLYIASGDGGWEGDPLEAGESLDTLLGKVLRIDVDVEGQAYAIPPDNPFAGQAGLVELFGISEDVFAEIHTEARPEIWAYGLRNPWKFQFDPETGDLYLPDVGQNVWEEINWQPADSKGGENYGWDFLMGSHCHPIQAEECDQVGILPVAEYNHDVGCAVVGLGVYRGQEATMDGIYFVSDFCSGKIWGLQRNARDDWSFEELLDTDLRVTGSGQDEDGDIYVTSCQCAYGSADAFENPPGALWQLVPADEVPEDATVAPTPAA
jgi:glucose/arabinose dehydrogenase